MLLLTLRPLCLMSPWIQPAVPLQEVFYTGMSLAPPLSVVGHGPPVTLYQLGQL